MIRDATIVWKHVGIVAKDGRSIVVFVDVLVAVVDDYLKQLLRLAAMEKSDRFVHYRMELDRKLLVVVGSIKCCLI